MSQFDATNFMNAVFEDALDDKRIPVPAGEYIGQIVEIKPVSGQISKGERQGEDWAKLNLVMELEDEGLKALLKRNKITMTYGVMLDLTPNGGLDMGPQRNTALGAVRTACNQNTKGQPWQPAMLVGHRLRVMVKHVPSIKDPSNMIADVSGVAKP